MTEVEELHRACRLGDVSLISKILEELPTCVDSLDAKLGWAPLYRTVICGHADASEFLLVKGADPDVQNRLGETPLHQAAMNNQSSLVQILLSRRANPNSMQNDGDTPLHNAASKGNAEIVRLLLKHKGNPNIANHLYGKTPFHIAVENDHYEVAKLLLSYNASLSATDKLGNRPIDLAKSERMTELLTKDAVVSSPPADLTPRDEIYDIEEQKFNKVDFSVEIPPDMSGHISRPESIMEPECEKGSMRSHRSIGSSGVHSSRPFSFGVTGNRSPFYTWLEKDSLQSLFEVLVANGYDDLEQLVMQMSSDMPITHDVLQKIGVAKIGHRLRLLSKLDNEVTRMSTRSSDISSSLKCCIQPAYLGPQMINQSLSDWLSSLNLGHLYIYFASSGFEELDYLLSCMNTNYPMTDSILQEIGIDKIGHRHRILSKLKDETHRRRFRRSPSVILEGTDKDSACQLCIIM